MWFLTTSVLHVLVMMVSRINGYRATIPAPSYSQPSRTELCGI